MTKITFGIIALNAQPLLEYNLRALYPFAHQIVVVEGATRSAVSLATQDGHSMDETLEMLRRFQAVEDIDHKLQIISAKDEGLTDGFWVEKDQMSQAYSKRATGDWLWQVDSDEFYREEDMRTVVDLVDSNPDISGISFPFHEFWGGFDYVTTGKWYLQDFAQVPRLFRWGPGFQYTSHRPPTVVNEKRVVHDPENWMDEKQMRKLGIYMYHYSYVFPKQAEQKVGYYSNVTWTDAFRNNQRWLKESYYGLNHPFFLSEKGWPILQWLERFEGQHPKVISDLRTDLAMGKVKEGQRTTKDIEKLLRSPRYTLATRILHFVMPPYWYLRRLLRPKKILAR